MELFDKEFVYFMWDDKLEGQKGFVANYINDLKLAVNQGYWTEYGTLHKGSDAYPFRTIVDERWCLCYYDPNYEAKKAFNEGKKVQILLAGGVYWRDVEDEVALERYIEEGRQFRVKPEEEKWIAYLARSKNSDYLTAGRADRWESIQKDYGAKTKLFIGAYDEAVKWYDARQKFAETVKAWEDGKKIQVTPKGTDKWVDLHCEPKWDLRDEYRVKPECPCENGIESKACVGCEHSEDGKQYRPYRDALEFIADYGKRFPTATPRPLGTMPLIWIAHKTDGTTRLIVEFSDRSVKIGCKVKPVDFGKLFEYWTYTDGSPVGMEVKE